MAHNAIHTLHEYRIGNTFMLRAPLLGLDVLKDISRSDDLWEILRKYYSNRMVMDSLSLASPLLKDKASAWIRQQDNSAFDEKAAGALLKYLIRMASRCTPFGMFAGICSGRFGNADNIVYGPDSDHTLHIRPDMHFLCSIVAKMQEDKILRQKLKYYPNSSLCRIGKEYRYIEFILDEHGYRHYELQSAVYSPELGKVIDRAAGGASIGDLMLAFAGDGLDEKEVEEYLHQLIDHQVLISELEPNLSGSEYFPMLMRCLNQLAYENRYTSFLERNQEKLNARPNLNGSGIMNEYDSILKDANKLGVSMEKCAFIQADMKMNTRHCILSGEVKKDVLGLIPVLMKLSRPADNPLLDRFRQAFRRRYDSSEVPLELLMDAEAGPGYLPSDLDAGMTGLLEGITNKAEKKASGKIQWHDVDRLLYSKLQFALKNGLDKIAIGKEDIDSLDPPGHGFPLSTSAMIRIYGKWERDSNKHLMQVESVGGAGAATLAGRFCHIDDGLRQEMKRIAAHEQELAGEHIIAEIIHLPQHRTGNVLQHPAFYDYEIPYLARSSAGKQFQIPLSDIMVSLRNNKVVLRSKRLGKYIIPRLSNAHNYSLGSLSAYRFLCDLQLQDQPSGFSFSWGPLEPDTHYLPRITYRNFILQRATWNVTAVDLKPCRAAKGIMNLRKEIVRLRARLGLPQQVILKDGDNELWIDLESTVGAGLFGHEIARRNSVCLQEYVLSPDTGVFSGKANEFVFFIYRVQ